MKVSIIIPVYNVSEYIERCLNSVIAQTYTDLECIIVDDCTPDDSIEKCERLITQYNGLIEFRILHHEHNRGLSAARNTGTEAARGEYIYYLDSDDEITPNCIEVLEKETEKHPEVEVVQGGSTAIPYNKWYDLSYYKHPCYIESNDWIRYNFFKCGEIFPVTAWNKLIRKECLTNNHISFKEGLIHEDELWTLNLVKVISRISIVGEYTYLHYATSNSIMSSTGKQFSAKNVMCILSIAFRDLDNPYKELQLYKYLWLLLDRIDWGYNTKEGLRAVLASIPAILRCGKKKLALKCIIHYLHVYTHQGHSCDAFKENIVARWEIETANSNKCCH